MSVEDPRSGELVLGRIVEGVAATVVGGLIVWFVTGTAPSSSPSSGAMPAATVAAVEGTPPPSNSLPVAPSENLAPQAVPTAEKVVEPRPAAPPSAAAEAIPTAATLAPISPPPATLATAPAPQEAEAAEWTTVETNVSVPHTAVPSVPSLVVSTTGQASAPSVSGSVPASASAAWTNVPAATEKVNAFPQHAALESLLLHEDFSRYREGDTTAWGPSLFIKTGVDRRHWLVSNVEGAHPVGWKMQLPGKFHFECRYSAYLPEVTKGAAGWWKEPVSTHVVFLNGQGAKYAIRWVIKYGSEPNLLNPLGSSLLDAKKYYHAITLPDGAAGEVAAIRRTGVLRIDRDDNSLTVHVDGQVAAVGTMRPVGPLVGLEIDVVKAKNGALSFTDFKIAR